MQREKDGAGWRPQPPAPSASLSAMPVPFEFGGFNSNPPTPRPNLPSCPTPRHPPPLTHPVGFGSVGGGGGGRDLLETPFLSAKGSLLSHIELSREVRMSREEKEEAKRAQGFTIKPTRELMPN